MALAGVQRAACPCPGTLRGFDYPYLYFYLPFKLLLLGAGTDLVFLLEDFKRSEKYNKIKQALLGRHLPQGAVPVTAQHWAAGKQREWHRGLGNLERL